MPALRLTGLLIVAALIAGVAPGLALAQDSVLGRPLAIAIEAGLIAPAGETLNPAPPRTEPKLQHSPLPHFQVAEGMGPLRYTVRSGDTLGRIAAHHGISLDVLTEANGLHERIILREGMDLLIPWSNPAGAARLGPDGPIVDGRGLHFVASISRQACWLFDDGAILRQWPCSTGRADSPSIPGNYTIQSRLPRAYNEPSEFWMPYWLGVYSAGDAVDTENGIHGLPYDAETGEKAWEDELGTPVTYGCIMLSDRAARELYTAAGIGMPVTILE